MLSSWAVVGISLTYMGLLFAVAIYGDRNAGTKPSSLLRAMVYSLSLGVYCASWSFYGSVGIAARSGFDYLSFYIGPFIVLVAGWPVLRIIVDISKRQNITSIADFISTRYGRNRTLGGLVAIIAVIGVVPHIAFQLKAIVLSLTAILPQLAEKPVSTGLGGHVGLAITVVMAGFSILLGTRYIGKTEHQNGLVKAVALQSVVKLIAFVTIGIFVTFWMIGGIGPMLDILSERTDIAATFFSNSDGDRWLAMTLLSALALLMLPHMFHLAVVENNNGDDIRRAAFLFPLYLFLISLFVLPVAVAGLNSFNIGSIDTDTFVLALPIQQGRNGLVLLAFLGGLSAATAMIIVETIALSIMVCNNIVVPVFFSKFGAGEYLHKDIGGTLLLIRRISIVAILALAYGYLTFIGSSAVLSQTALLSFAAVAQFAPAMLGGMMWRRGTAKGAMAGLIAGSALWAYTLLLPSFADAGLISQSFVTEGPFGLGGLKPRVLFNLAFDPLAHGVLWSLFANISVYVGVSFLTQISPVERLQAAAFMSPELTAATPSFRLWRTTITVAQLQKSVARYIGQDRARRSFEEFADQERLVLDPHAEADSRLFLFAEHLLASVVGAASSRLVLALMLERQSGAPRGNVKLLDDASEAIQYNRNILQSAIDHMSEGIAVFDGDLSLISWNRQFRELLALPEEIGRIGVPLDEVLTVIIGNAITGPEDEEQAVTERLAKLTTAFEPYQERLAGSGSVLDVRSSQMPNAGIVVTFTDITERVRAAEALERRVEERTLELTELNQELSTAKAIADAANLSKTRFIAAASHDILQPLNAARLFTSSLGDRQQQSEDLRLVENVDASLEAVEEILTALLDISRLDTGVMQPEVSSFNIGDILNVLAVEFAPAADAKNLDLRVIACSAVVETDRRLLRRILQNLLSNAIKYTNQGRVLMGCRRQGGRLNIQVHDTGVGIAEANRDTIFKEFERLNPPGNNEAGLGLGLAIVDRIAKMLDCELTIRSELGVGTMFSLSVPLGHAISAKDKTKNAARSPQKSIAGYSVLVIDNEQAIVDGMRTLLKGWGCNVYAATGEEHAVSIINAKDNTIDIVLADFHLWSDKDGLELIEDIRRAAGRQVPAVLITADRTREVQDLAASMNVIHLPKPVKPANLRASMARAMVSQLAKE